MDFARRELRVNVAASAGLQATAFRRETCKSKKAACKGCRRTDLVR
jgi:hypothetical protein